MATEQARQQGGGRRHLRRAYRQAESMYGVDQQIDALTHLGQGDGSWARMPGTVPQPEPADVDRGVAGNIVDDVFGFSHVGGPRSGEGEVEQVVHGVEQTRIV